MRFLRLGKAFGHEQLLNAQMDGGWSSKRLLIEGRTRAKNEMGLKVDEMGL